MWRQTGRAGAQRLRGAGGRAHLQSLVSRRRPRAAQLLVYEAEQELHPEQRQGHGYCWETLRVVPCWQREGARAAPPPGSPTQRALKFTVSAALPWGAGDQLPTEGPLPQNVKNLKASSRAVGVPRTAAHGPGPRAGLLGTESRVSLRRPCSWE